MTWLLEKKESVVVDLSAFSVQKVIGERNGSFANFLEGLAHCQRVAHIM